MYLPIQLFVYDLFNDPVNSSQCTLLSDKSNQQVMNWKGYGDGCSLC